MDVLQERILLMDLLKSISWDMQLLKELFSTGNQIKLFIHRSHHVWFDEYNYFISIEYKRTTGYLLLRQYPESLIYNSDLLNLIPCELDITSTSFFDKKFLHIIFSYLPLERNFGFNLLDNKDFTIPYITDTIPNSPAGNKLPTQAKWNVCIIATNGEDPITAQGDLDELNFRQTPRGKSKVNISLCKRKSYQITDLEEIRYQFDQFRPVVSHLEVRLPKKSPTPKNVCECLKVPQRKFWKEYLFVQYDKNKNVRLLSAPIPIKYLPERKKILCSLIDPSIK